jgi:integrase
MPSLARTQVRRLTAWDLDRLYARMVDAGKGPSTIHQVHVVLSGALRQAVKWGWCPSNVARMASPPTVPAPRVPPTTADVQRLIEAAEKRNPILAALVMLAALTGARRGELSALRWTDVDLDGGTLRIARSMLDLPGRVQERPTKSHQERTLALGDAGVHLLELHREQVVARAQFGEVKIAPDGVRLFRASRLRHPDPTRQRDGVLPPGSRRTRYATRALAQLPALYGYPTRGAGGRVCSDSRGPARPRRCQCVTSRLQRFLPAGRPGGR